MEALDGLVQILVMLPNNFMMLGMFLSLPVPQFIHLQNEDSNSTYFSRLLGE